MIDHVGGDGSGICPHCGRGVHHVEQHPNNGKCYCISVPLTTHPVPRGCVEYITSTGQRAFVRAVRQPARHVRIHGIEWFYYTASGWWIGGPDDPDTGIPEEAQRRARELASAAS